MVTIMPYFSFQIEMSVIGAAVPSELEPLGVKAAEKLPSDASLHLVTSRDLLSEAEVTQKLAVLSAAIKPGGFVLLREDIVPDNKKVTSIENSGLNLIAVQIAPKGILVLLRKPLELPSLPTKVIKITSSNFDWVEGLRDTLQASEKDPQRILLVSEGEETSGIVGLINCLKQEPGGTNLRYDDVTDFPHYGAH